MPATGLRIVGTRHFYHGVASLLVFKTVWRRLVIEVMSFWSFGFGFWSHSCLISSVISNKNIWTCLTIEHFETIHFKWDMGEYESRGCPEGAGTCVRSGRAGTSGRSGGAGTGADPGGVGTGAGPGVVSTWGVRTGGRLRGAGSGVGLHHIPSNATSNFRVIWAAVGGLDFSADGDGHELVVDDGGHEWAVDGGRFA